LYIHDIISFPTRPIKELKDFTRVHLEPGEAKTIQFKITPDKLESYDINMQRTVQPGDFEIMVGTSSVDYLKAKLTVQ
jgi:beta-glucosidase